MCIRLMIACGLLLAAGNVSAQHTCGPDCGATDDGSHTANRFEDRFAVPPSSYGQTAAPNNYYSPDRRRQYAQRLIQEPSGEFDQQPFNRQPPSEGLSQREPGHRHGAHGHSHGGHGCNHDHGGTDHHSARSRQRFGTPGYDQPAPGRNRMTPPSQAPNPNDLQPMSPPSLPPQSLSARSLSGQSFTGQSRTARGYTPLPPSVHAKSSFKPRVSVTWLD